VGAGQFELAEFVDRRFASKTVDPVDFVFGADVRNGIMDDYDFARDVFRGETAMYQAMLEHPDTDGAGQEDNALLTNIFGSPILAAGWKASATKSAYYCATTMDPANCAGQTPPLDAFGNLLRQPDGRPLLAGYPGAFGTTPFSLGQTRITVT